MSNHPADKVVHFGLKRRHALVGGIGFLTNAVWANANTAYLGNIGTNTIINNRNPVVETKYNQARIPQIATEHLATAPMIAFDNWYVKEGRFIETPTIGLTKFTASVEFPVGVFTQIKWSGSAQLSVAPGTTSALSDELQKLKGGPIPQGATYWINLWAFNDRGSPFSGDNSLDQANGGAWNFSSQELPDLTMTGGVVNRDSNTNCIGPALVVYRTTKPTVLVIGDSRNKGTHDTWADGGGQRGEICRSLVKAAIGVSNAGVPADRCNLYLASSALRTARKAHHSHVICQYGINDISSGDSAEMLIENIRSVAALFSDKFFFACTVSPKTIGNFSSVAGQRVDARNEVRIEHNTNIREGRAGGTGFIDLCVATESSLNSGKWRPNLTDDGVHETPAGAMAIVDMGLIDRAVIDR